MTISDKFINELTIDALGERIFKGVCTGSLYNIIPWLIPIALVIASYGTPSGENIYVTVILYAILFINKPVFIVVFIYGFFWGAFFKDWKESFIYGFSMMVSAVFLGAFLLMLYGINLIF